MAIYKPSNCTPFLNALDLTEAQDVQCELNTSNVNVVGYKMRILDNKNKVVFNGKNFTELNDTSLYDYYNTGLNGSVLNLPIVVTDPNQSNENDLLFTGYNWGRWKPSYETLITDSTISYFYYGEHYFRISPDTMSPAAYISLNTVYKKINGCYREVTPKPSMDEAIRLEYYYKSGAENAYTKISKDKISEGDYLTLDRVFINKVNEYNIAMTATTATVGETAKGSVTIDVDGGVTTAEIVATYITSSNGQNAIVESSTVRFDEHFITFDVVTNIPNCIVTAIIKFKYGTGSGAYVYSYTTPSKAQAINDVVYYHPYRPVESRDDWETAPILYERNIQTSLAYNGYNNPNKDEAVLQELYYKRYFYTLPSKPEFSISYDRYYYKDDYNNMVVISGENNYMEFKAIDRKNISKNEAINEGYYYKNTNNEYVKMTFEYKGNYSETFPVLYKQYSYNNIVNIYDSNYNYYILTTTQRPKNLNDAKGKGYFYKERYDIQGIKPEWQSVSGHLNEYFVLAPLPISRGDTTSYEITVKTLQEAGITDKTIYDAYRGTIYIRKGKYNPLLDDDTNNTDSFIYYKSVDDIVGHGDITAASIYEEIPAIYAQRYISVAGLDVEYYETQIYDLYKLNITYTPLKGAKPTFANSERNYYYLSKEFIPITQGYCEYDVIKDFYTHDEGEYYVISKEYTNHDQAYNNGAFVLDYEKVDIKPSKNMAIKNGYYTIKGGKYVKIDYDMPDVVYNSLNTIYQLVGMVELEKEESPINNRDLYRKVENFYNGYPYQPYKWQICLQQGDIGIVNVEDMRSKWFDMTITSGNVAGSLSSRIQGIYSEEIYKDYYIQLVDNNKKQTSNRVRIKSYDHSFGYLYPQDGGFSETDVKNSSYFCIYKETNDPEVVSSNRKVNWCTTKDIDVKIGSATIKTSFSPENAFSKYFIQKYSGTVSASQINMQTYDDGGDSSELIVLGQTLILVKNQENSAYNGVFMLSSITTNSEETTLRWLRSANADSYADYINKAWYVEKGTYAGKNMVSDAIAGQGIINSAPLNFSEEKPITIYPTPNEEYVSEYDSMTFDLEARKIYSPIFKNSNTRTFVRPFIGLMEGMRFKYGLSDYDSVIINSVNSDLWYVKHNTLPYGKVLEPDADEYTVTSYFKNSDENPFFGYKKPYIKIDIENLTNDLDENLFPIVANRYVSSTAVYYQEQNKSWKNFQWTLYNETQDLVMYSTDIVYSGSFSNKFIGLEDSYNYVLRFTVENEVGVTTITEQNFTVSVDVETNLLPLTAQLNCDETQSINFSVVGNGIIQPKYTSSIDYEDEKMEISNGKILREYGNVYDEVLFSSSVSRLAAPSTNNFTLNSSHELNEYYQGKIIELIFDNYDRVDDYKNLQDGDGRFKLSIDIGYDTDIKTKEEIYKDYWEGENPDPMMGETEIIVSPNRNDLNIQFIHETYVKKEDGDGIKGRWEDDKLEKYGEIPMKIIYFGEQNPDGTLGIDGKWKNPNLPVFSLGRRNAEWISPDEGETSNRQYRTNYDYLYTTIPYTFTEIGGKKSVPIKGYYNLASSEYKFDNPDTEKYKLAYTYNSDSDWGEIETRKWGTLSAYDKTNFGTRISKNLKEENTSLEYYGVWFDEFVRTNKQANGKNVLVTNRKSAVWVDELVDELEDKTTLYWNDNNTKFGCYKQADLNEKSNHSGRQILANHIVSFNVPVSNYDYEQDTGALGFTTENCIAFFIKKEVN